MLPKMDFPDGLNDYHLLEDSTSIVPLEVWDSFCVGLSSW
jgi:hypothetical protein